MGEIRVEAAYDDFERSSMTSVRNRYSSLPAPALVCLWSLAAVGALVSVLTAGTLGDVGAAGFQKAYFGATKPRTWAKYTMTIDGKTESVHTSSRLPDEKGRARVRVRTDFTSGAYQGTWSLSDYTLKAGYSVENDALDYGKATESLTMRSKSATKPMKMKPDMLEAMLNQMPDYASTAVFVSTETVGGKTCDHYKYSQKHPGSPEQIETGELWLSDTVPFGLVRQRAVFKEPSGKVVTEYEMNLAESGTGAAPETKASKRPPASKPLR
jgi:hypothetical protein